MRQLHTNFRGALNEALAQLYGDDDDGEAVEAVQVMLSEAPQQVLRHRLQAHIVDRELYTPDAWHQLNVLHAQGNDIDVYEVCRMEGGAPVEWVGDIYLIPTENATLFVFGYAA